MKPEDFKKFEKVQRFVGALVGFFVLYVGFWMTVKKSNWPEGHPWVGIFLLLLALSQFASVLPKDKPTPRGNFFISSLLSVSTVIVALFAAVSLHR